MSIATRSQWNKGPMPADGAVYSDEGDTWYCEYCWKTVAESHSTCSKHLKNLQH